MNRVACGLAAALILAPSARAGETAWYTLQADGALIGYATHEEVDRPDGREIVQVQAIDVASLTGMPVRVGQRQVRREDAAGRTLQIVADEEVGRTRTRTVARIEGASARVTRQTAAGRSSVVVPLPRGVRFDDGEGLLRGWDPVATPRLAFDAFDLDAMAVEQVTIEPAPAVPGDPPGARAALRRRYVAGELQGVVRLILDAEGEITSVVQPLFGATVVSRIATRDAALAEHAPYPALRGVVTKSAYRISGPTARGHIRYRFGFRDGLAFTPPQTPEQRVTEAPDGATLDICGGCGPGLPTDDATLAAALRPTPWLQSDDLRIRRLAGPVARMKVSDARKMQLLLEVARPHLGRVDFAGHFSAVETLKRRAGDCTEASVLLAALGRAAGIPTKVANGLVYSRAYYHGVSNAFMPHSWTLAYVDGRWRSFDLALDGFESTHVALTVGDGDARSLMASGRLAGLLVWNGMTAVRTPGEPEPP